MAKYNILIVNKKYPKNLYFDYSKNLLLLYFLTYFTNPSFFLWDNERFSHICTRLTRPCGPWSRPSWPSRVPWPPASLSLPRCSPSPRAWATSCPPSGTAGGSVASRSSVVRPGREEAAKTPCRTGPAPGP